ncbi:hypothetical protein [Vibrio sonorensis]|uniref:hypothetical protein n=1 Tax=Vibrio sonorensis TaxID=1004316 RepID=UPI0008D94B60|nr:hypothetical protein [Vibrio sonorensis]
MEPNQSLYKAFFDAQDRFLAPTGPAGFEPDVIGDYIHSTTMLTSLYEPGAEQENNLLCELFLRQVYTHLLDAIADPSRSRIFRRVCLDSIHLPLIHLKRYYYQFDNGDAVFRALKQKLQYVQAPLD